MFLLCVCVDVHWASLVKARWVGFFYHYRREMIQSGMNEECFYYHSRNNVAIVFGNLVISNCLFMCVQKEDHSKCFSSYSIPTMCQQYSCVDFG